MSFWDFLNKEPEFDWKDNWRKYIKRISKSVALENIADVEYILESTQRENKVYSLILSNEIIKLRERIEKLERCEETNNEKNG
jgi:hypothetical protein